MRYQVIDQGGTNKSLFIYADGIPHTVSDSHVSYKTLLEYLEGGGEDAAYVKELMDGRAHVTKAFQRLSERITLHNDELHFDGTKIDTALSRHIIRLAREGDKGLEAFVKFMENLALNPSPLSRIHLFKWIDGRDFTVTEDGLIVAYKAVQRKEDGTLVSITSGTNTVIVNDEEVTGQVPNPIGAVVEIARDKVDPDREAHCSYGLHVGMWDYVVSFGGYGSVKLKVLVNPRDVVAVPSDSNSTKMRVCRYKIVEEIGSPIASPIVFSSNPDDLGDEAPLFEDDVEEEYFDDEDDYDDHFDYNSYGDDEEEEELEEWEEAGFGSEEEFEEYLAERAREEEEAADEDDAANEEEVIEEAPVKGGFWKNLFHK